MAAQVGQSRIKVPGIGAAGAAAGFVGSDARCATNHAAAAVASATALHPITRAIEPRGETPRALSALPSSTEAGAGSWRKTARSLQSSSAGNSACAGNSARAVLPSVTRFSAGGIGVDSGAVLWGEVDFAAGAMRPVRRRMESGNADARAGDADVRDNVIARATTLLKPSAGGLRLNAKAEGGPGAGAGACVVRAAGIWTGTVISFGSDGSDSGVGAGSGIRGGGAS